MTENKKDESPGCSQSGTDHGYSVEVRYNSYEPCEWNGEIFSKQWKKLSTNYCEKGIGVPTHNCIKFYYGALHLMSYQAAKTFQYWFHASLEVRAGLAAYGQSLLFESRIIKHKCEYSVKETKIESIDVLTSKDFLDK